MFERIASENGQVRLQLKGAMDGAGCQALREGFAALAAAPEGDVVLDLTNVSTLAGPGVGAIAFLFKRLHSRGRRLVITGVTGQPLGLMRELGLTRVLGLPSERRSRARRVVSWAWAR